MNNNLKSLIVAIGLASIASTSLSQTANLDSAYVISYNTGQFGNFKTRTIYPASFSSNCESTFDSSDIAKNSQIVVNLFSNERQRTSVDSDIKFNIYPNPSSGAITVSLNSKLAGPGTINIVGSDGRLFFNQSCTIVSGENEIPIVFKGAPGSYFVECIVEDGRRSRQLIIRK